MCVVVVHYIAIALTKHTDEVVTLQDLIQANVERLVLIGLLLCDAPSQIDLVHIDQIRRQFGAQHRENCFGQYVTLRVHIPKGG